MILGGVYALAPTNSRNSVSAEVMSPVVLQLDEIPEVLGSFRRLIIYGGRVHPVTELLTSVASIDEMDDGKLWPFLIVGSDRNACGWAFFDSSCLPPASQPRMHDAWLQPSCC